MQFVWQQTSNMDQIVNYVGLESGKPTFQSKLTSSLVFLDKAEEVVWDKDDASSYPLALLNRLGAEGWQVVTHTIERSALGPTMDLGDVSYPVGTRTLLMREVL